MPLLSLSIMFTEASKYLLERPLHLIILFGNLRGLIMECMLVLSRVGFHRRISNIIMLIGIPAVSSYEARAQQRLNEKTSWTLTDSLVYVGTVYWCLKEEGYLTNTQAGESVRQTIHEFMEENQISMDRLTNIISDNDFEKRVQSEIDAAGGCRPLADEFIKEATTQHPVMQR